MADTPVDQKGYNHIPEHFETIHYQDFNYVASKGPFGLSMSWIVPPGGGTSPTNVADGVAHSASVIDTDANLSHHGGTVPSGVSSGVLINNGAGYAAGTTGAMNVDTVDATTKYAVGDRVYNSSGVNIGVVTAVASTSITIGAGTNVAVANNDALYLRTKYNFSGFWPGGSHGGGATSRLESYGHALIGWGSDTYGMDCETYQDSTGIATLTLPNTRNRCFGYRMGVRQAYNRPRWSPYVRGWLEVANSNALLGYYHGPLIQHDSKTNGWDYVGADGDQSDVDFNAMYVGILERLTQVSSLFGQDQIGRQVRYSDGRRMTKSFGCPVRTLRNPSTTRRLYPGDNQGQEISELAEAHRYYMVES